jgi:hypothetical protein
VLRGFLAVEFRCRIGAFFKRGRFDVVVTCSISSINVSLVPVNTGLCVAFPIETRVQYPAEGTGTSHCRQAEVIVLGGLPWEPKNESKLSLI